MLEALRERGMDVSRWVLRRERGLQGREKERERGKVGVGPGLNECEAGYETNNCGEMCVRCRGPCALGEGGQNIGVPRLVLQESLAF